MTHKEAQSRIIYLLKRGLNIPLYRCCRHRKEDIVYYLNFYQNFNYESFQLKEYTNGFYWGQLKDGKRHGYGYFVWSDNSIHAGRWYNEKQNGDGVYIANNGYICFGEWKDGEQHGRCLERGENGIEAESDYFNGLRTRVISNSDNFVDLRTGIEYNTGNNFSGEKKGSGCGAIIVIIIFVIIVFNVCANINF